MTLSERVLMRSFAGATQWLKSEPLGPAELECHVVLVNSWTWTCINWLGHRSTRVTPTRAVSRSATADPLPRAPTRTPRPRSQSSLRDGGLNLLDAGPLKQARQLEAMGLLHMTLQSSLGTGFSTALKILA